MAHHQGSAVLASGMMRTPVDVHSAISADMRSCALTQLQELQLMQHLLLWAATAGLHPVAYEWEVHPGRSQDGKGDLVFQHDSGQYVVVEVKWLNLQCPGHTARVSRTKKRSKVKEQACRYAEAWQSRTGQRTLAATFTNECVDGRYLHLWRKEGSNIIPDEAGQSLIRSPRTCAMAATERPFDHPGMLYTPVGVCTTGFGDTLWNLLEASRLQAEDRLRLWT